MNDTLVGLVVVAIGVVAFVGAALNWRIVSHSGKLLNRIFGDSIARAIYAAVGLVLVVLGTIRFAG
ncbi:MAG: hypothetical protein PVJ21_18735 [Anaerolineales bacterium]|jgi:hypothetical protein